VAVKVVLAIPVIPFLNGFKKLVHDITKYDLCEVKKEAPAASPGGGFPEDKQGKAPISPSTNPYGLN
jgi:hypothetical protein